MVLQHQAEAGLGIAQCNALEMEIGGLGAEVGELGTQWQHLCLQAAFDKCM